VFFPLARHARPPHRVIHEPGGIWLCGLKESNYQIGTSQDESVRAQQGGGQ
jgi:hypothetical protein